MIVVMQFGASQAETDAVCKLIRDRGFEPLVMAGEDRLAIGIPAALGPDDRIFLESAIGSMDGVSKITQTSSPYKLASIEFHRARTTVPVKGLAIGDGRFTI